MALKNIPLLDRAKDFTNNQITPKTSSNSLLMQSSLKNNVNVTKQYQYNKSTAPGLEDILVSPSNRTGNSQCVQFVPGGIKYFTKRVADDTKRYGKFIASKKGLLWIAKQQGLHLMNPKGEFTELINPSRVFNPVKLAANYAGKLVGLHTETHGILSDGNYEKMMQTRNALGNSISDSRLIQMYNEFGMGDLSNTYIPSNKLGTVLLTGADKLTNGRASNVINAFSNTMNNVSNSKAGKLLTTYLNYNNKKINVLSGISGPHSVFGVGFTNIHSSVVGNPIDYNYTDRNGKTTLLPKNTKEDNYKTILEQSENGSDLITLHNALYSGQNAQQPGGSNNSGGNPVTKQLIGNYNDFQSINKFINPNTRPVAKKWTNFEPDSYFIMLEDQFKNIPGYKERFKYDPNMSYNQNWNMHDRLGIPEIGNNNLDAINMGSNTSEDFIKVKINNIQFRCTISGLSDTFNPDWSEEQYIGRPDKVYNYQGVSRAISFDFILNAYSLSEMNTIYTKLNQLAQMVSPDIDNAGKMTGRIVDLKIGMWLSESVPKGIPCIIDSLSFTIDDEYVWDIINELPMTIKVAIGFKVIGNKIPSSSTVYFGNSTANVPQ